MKPKDILLYMDIAERVSRQSHARRLKVGGVFVAESGVMTIGYNGTLPGHDNNCENEVYHEREWQDEPTLVTKPEVLHAEENILGKLLEEGVSSRGGSLFLTHTPCINCAKLIARAKIKNLYYKSEYRTNDGINFLRGVGVYVEKVCDS